MFLYVYFSESMRDAMSLETRMEMGEDGFVPRYRMMDDW